MPSSTRCWNHRKSQNLNSAAEPNNSAICTWWSWKSLSSLRWAVVATINSLVAGTSNRPNCCIAARGPEGQVRWIADATRRLKLSSPSPASNNSIQRKRLTWKRKQEPDLSRTTRCPAPSGEKSRLTAGQREVSRWVFTKISGRFWSIPQPKWCWVVFWILGVSVQTIRLPEAVRAAKRTAESLTTVVARSCGTESRSMGGHIEEPTLQRSRSRQFASPMASQLLEHNALWNK